MHLYSKKDLSAEGVALLVGAGILVLLIVGLVIARLFAPPDPSYLLATFTEEHVRMLAMFDNRGQQMAYRVFLVLVGMLAVAVWCYRPSLAEISVPGWLHSTLSFITRYSGLVLLVLLIFCFLLQYKLQPGSSVFILQGQYGLGFIPSRLLQLGLMVGGGVMVYSFLAFRAARLVPQRRERLLGIIIVAAVAIYAAGVFLYGITLLPDFSSFTPELLAGVEWHYAGSVATADRLALGDRIGEIAIHAGLLPSALMGFWQNVFGMLDLGGHIQFIAWLQLIFFLMAAAAYAKWYSGRWLPAVIAVLLVLPWVVPIHAAVLYPNQSAWRFLGLGFGTLALVYLHARPAHNIAGPLGFVAGLALLWNIETGLAVTLAYMGFIVVRTSTDSGNIKLGWVAFRFLTGLAVALLGFFCVVRLTFGYWAHPVGILKSFPLLGGFGKGYGGLQLTQIDPLAALIFIHALYALVRGLVRWGSGTPVSARKACEMALAGLILVWGAYYFKGPHFWNLWSYKFLYGFFVGHLLAARWPRKPWRLVYFGRSARLLALALIILPNVVTANLLTARSLGIAARQPPCVDENVVSGLCLSGEMAHIVRQKAAALRKLVAQEPLLFLSANSYLMPLMTGINQKLQMRDPFSETILKSDFDRLVQDILSVHPARVLFDDPSSPVSGYPAHRSFYGRVRAAIATEYTQQDTADGWEIWADRKSGGHLR
jgi:hypothetical protein